MPSTNLSDNLRLSCTGQGVFFSCHQRFCRILNHHRLKVNHVQWYQQEFSYLCKITSNESTGPRRFIVDNWLMKVKSKIYYSIYFLIECHVQNELFSRPHGEGYVFTGICLSSGGRRRVPLVTGPWFLIPGPFLGEGYPWSMVPGPFLGEEVFLAFDPRSLPQGKGFPWSLVPGHFLGGGKPQSDPRTGVPPLGRTRTPPHPSPQTGPGQASPHMPRTGYGAGGTPLEVRQEDFLITDMIWYDLTLFKETWDFRVMRPISWGKATLVLYVTTSTFGVMECFPLVQFIF